MQALTKRLVWSAVLFGTFAAIACSTDAHQPDSTGGSGATGTGGAGDGSTGDNGGRSSGSSADSGGRSSTPGDGTADAGGAAGAPADSSTDLFSCGATFDCGPICSHIGLGDCGGSDQFECTAEFAQGDTPGLLLTEGRPGPYCGEWETLYLLLGDGRAVVQSESRDCSYPDACGAQCHDPWNVEAQEICDVVPEDCIPPESIRCQDFPTLANCEPLDEELGCDDLAAALEGGAGKGSAGAAGAADEP